MTFPSSRLVSALVAACVTVLVCLPAGADVTFRKIVVDKTFRSEGVATGDINHDGKRDIFAGDVWYAAPDWKMHAIRPVGKYNPTRGYSKVFAHFADDVNGDGWIDSVVVDGWNCCPARWYANPKNKPGPGKEGQWAGKQFTDRAGNETPLYVDLLGDGSRVALFVAKGELAWYAPPRKDGADWTKHVINAPKDRKPASDVHTFGCGDVNGDGRKDVLVAKGWFEAPADRTKRGWTFHPVDFGNRCADLIPHDLDGDGDADVLSSAAHAYGIWWHEQIREGGKVTWKKHTIYDKFSQTHALILADINRDGKMDFVTGKRFYAHNGHDPGGKEPVVLYWFERTSPLKAKPKFTPHLIDTGVGIGTQFEVVDMNGDGLLDIVTSNKKGVHVFLQGSQEPPKGRSAAKATAKTAAAGEIDFDKIAAQPLFDGKTFAGWEGNLKHFRIADGAIVGGTLKERVPRNEFLCTTKRYGDFELSLSCKILGKGVNAGIQIRSERIPNHHEVRGYQADMADNMRYWGALYDESRRRKILAAPDPKEIRAIVKHREWNDYRIRCVGPRIQLWVNGRQTVDYTEPDAKIPREGIIGLQIHGGPPSEAWYKDITIKVPPT